ncbi:hypothetical protein D3C74_00880 [compost metagenome]
MTVNGYTRKGLLYLRMSCGFHKMGDYREEYSVSPGDKLMSHLTRRTYIVIEVHTGMESYAELALYSKEQAEEPIEAGRE